MEVIQQNQVGSPNADPCSLFLVLPGLATCHPLAKKTDAQSEGGDPAQSEGPSAPSRKADGVEDKAYYGEGNLGTRQ